jgi:hypothetical protein
VGPGYWYLSIALSRSEPHTSRFVVDQHVASIPNGQQRLGIAKAKEIAAEICPTSLYVTFVCACGA